MPKLVQLVLLAYPFNDGDFGFHNKGVTIFGNVFKQ